MLGTMQHPAFVGSHFERKPCNCTSLTSKAVSKFWSSENKQRASVLLQVRSALPSLGIQTLGRVVSPIYLEKKLASLFQTVNVLIPERGGVGADAKVSIYAKAVRERVTES